MVNFNPDIFRAYDIRGVYGKDFDEDFVFKLGASLVKYLKSGKLVIGQDARPTSPPIAEALIRGISSAGCDVLVLGKVSSPFFYYAINKLGADGGIMVTASHNDLQYNGFKLYREGAFPLDSDLGLANIKKNIEEDNFSVPKYAGKILSDDGLLEKYTSFICDKSDLKPGESKITIAIDADNTMQKELEPIIKKLQIRVAAGAEICFKFDTDGDRVAVLNPAGERIRGDLVAGVLAGQLRGGWFSKPKMVHDLRFSRGVTEKLSSAGIKLVRSRVGHTFIKKVMKREGADLGGELSGHIYFREAKYAENAALAMLKIVKIISATGKSLDELIMPFKTWENSGEINLPANNWSAIVARLKEKYADGGYKELDGLTVEYSDWWFNLRPSNTEPVLRLVVEAKIKNLLNEKVEEVRNLIGAGL